MCSSKLLPKTLGWDLPRVLLDAGWVVRVQRQGEAPHEALYPDQAGDGQETAAHVEISIGCFVGNAVGDNYFPVAYIRRYNRAPLLQVRSYVQSGRLQSSFLNGLNCATNCSESKPLIIPHYYSPEQICFTSKSNASGENRVHFEKLRFGKSAV